MNSKKRYSELTHLKCPTAQPPLYTWLSPTIQGIRLCWSIWTESWKYTKEKEYQVMTNSPKYSSQLAINDYWKEIGGLQMLPGTNRSSDRFCACIILYSCHPADSRRTHCRPKCTECDEKCICSLRHHHSR